MNASATRPTSPTIPARSANPPTAASARFAIGPASETETVSRVRLRK